MGSNQLFERLFQFLFELLFFSVAIVYGSHKPMVEARAVFVQFIRVTDYLRAKPGGRVATTPHRPSTEMRGARRRRSSRFTK